jgi:hypothetical protein
MRWFAREAEGRKWEVGRCQHVFKGELQRGSSTQAYLNKISKYSKCILNKHNLNSNGVIRNVRLLVENRLFE